MHIKKEENDGTMVSGCTYDFSSVLASSGLWAYLQKKSEQKDVKTEMLIGLAHDRIMYLGMSYIDRGCVTQDE